jgi:hypothetical protein
MSVSVFCRCPVNSAWFLRFHQNDQKTKKAVTPMLGEAPWPKELPRQIAVISVMERDPFETAIDAILASADGDIRRALRAVLMENVVLESEIRQLYAVSEHGKPVDWRSLH